AAILLEPAARNTAPAIAAAAHWALARGEDDPMLVMPSDHMIPDAAAFEAAVEGALSPALDGNLLTFGIRPTSAHTGYGYIQAAEPVSEHSDKVLVVPVTFAWSDVGSWDAVRELMPADDSGNVLQGDVLTLDVTNSLIRSDSSITVAVVGLDRVVCVVTDDAVFIAPLDRAQDVKKVVEELRARGSVRT